MKDARDFAYTPAAALQALRAVAECDGVTPTPDRWTAAKLRPAVTTYQKMFGSWRDALIAAGMTPTRAPEAKLDLPLPAIIERLRNGEPIVEVAHEQGVTAKLLRERVAYHIRCNNLPPVGRLGGSSLSERERERQQLNDLSRIRQS